MKDPATPCGPSLDARIAMAERAYRDRTNESARRFDLACGVLAGGVVGSITYFPPYPPTMERAGGAHLWDVDGNRYIDYLMVWGALILGHGHPSVDRALRAQLDAAGTLAFGAPHRWEVELARALQRHVPSAERVRFTNSGLEATLLCVRLAAASTGRYGLAKFEGHYHGAHDRALISYAPVTELAGAPDAPNPVPDSLGILPSLIDSTVVLPWNDWAGTSALLRRHAGQVAAVLLEPVQGGFIAPVPDFLEQLRLLTTELGILLVFDEVKTGLRLGLGGAQARFGVVPDLTAMGKALGGDLPIGAVTGRREILELTIPDLGPNGVFHSGTFNGHPAVMAAGLAVIDQLEQPGTYERLDAATTELKERFRRAATRHGVAMCTPGVGPVFGVVLSDVEPRNYRDTIRGDRRRRRLLDLRLLAGGVFLRPGDRFNLSLAHSDRDIEETAEIFAHAIAHL